MPLWLSVRLPDGGRKPKRGAMLTLPNILTLSRIVAVPLLVALLWWPQWEAGYAAAFAL
jgi:phosphatidylglycerophosphate synthase